jgi:hypothetical protein
LKVGVKFWVIGLLLVGCSRDEVVFIPDLTREENRSALLAEFTDGLVSHRINYQGESMVIAANDGLFIEIPSLAFSSLTTGEAVKGDIRIDIQEVSRKKKNLLRIPSLVTENGCLACEKLIQIRTSKNGEQLQMDKPLYVFVPAPFSEQNNDASLFTIGSSQTDDHWDLLPPQMLLSDSGVWQMPYKESFYECKGYRIRTDKGDGWYCIGSSLDFTEENGDDLCVELNPAFMPENTLVFFLAANRNAMIRLEKKESDPCYRFPFSGHPEKIPGKIITLSNFGNENYHFGMTNVVLGQATQILVSPKATTKEEIANILRTL